nr:flagellar protein FlgN [Desulfovibrio sp.]
MYQLIVSSLDRQNKGLSLLQKLLLKEYEIICERKVDLVAHAEFSIQELIRQLVVEKEFVMGLLKGMRAREYAQGLADELAEPLVSLLDSLEK